VLGAEVDLDLLAAVLTEPPEALLDHLEEGVRRHMLTEHVQGFRFRHQLIREALCAATGPSRTALLHRQAARCLQARGHRADPWDVAYHARLGGDLPLAASALADAGERAAERFDHVEALRLFDDALSIQDGPEVRLRRAKVALPAGRFEQAAADAGAALAGGVGAEGMEVAAIAAYLLRDFKRCRRLGEDGARLTDDPRLRTSCLALAGRVSHVDGDLSAAMSFLHQAMQEAPPEMQALARLWSAPLHTDLGDPAAALDLLDLGVKLAARHPFVAPHRHLAAAEALGQLGRPEAALAELKLVDEVAAQQRTERFAARADNCRAWILRNIGEHAQADERNEAAYARSLGAPGMSEPVADALLGLAEGRLRAGEPGRALELVKRLRSQANDPHPFAWRHELQAKLLQGWCAEADGDTEAALSCADEVTSEADRLAVPRFQVLAAGLKALAKGEPLPAHDLMRVTPLEAPWLLKRCATDG
jgi:tetratricopeptide (TPR) repeat protein